MNEISQARVVRYARTSGVIYLLYFLAAFGAAVLTRGLVVSSDIAEIVFMLWLLVKGVEASVWHDGLRNE